MILPSDKKIEPKRTLGGIEDGIPAIISCIKVVYPVSLGLVLRHKK